MSLEAALYSVLANHFGVFTLVDGRIYPRQIPQEAALPAIAYLRISTRDTGSMDCGDSRCVAARVQLDIVAETYVQAKEVAVQVRDALRSADTLRCHKLQERDMPGQNPDYFRVMLEYSIWYTETFE